ncbi:S10 family peptidase [Sphingomonas adhaesiva]|uniref:S10 family peptidase n=1 Tax=Sphingomonas adhaesiva TaxID=28212 RepID=UPI002FF9E264
MTVIRYMICAALASAAWPLAAQDAPRAERPPLSPVSLAAPVVTKHKGVFGGKAVAYTATVEPVVVDGMDGKPAARLVATSYIADGMAAGRPVAFVFNGGPIAPTTPLHMGAFGPKRIAIPNDLAADPATFKVVDNGYAPLDAADIVIFDPANTGYSRTLPGIAPESQFSNVADGRQLAQLVQAWRRLHNRPTAPVFLIGESYGTMRAVEAADQLQKAGDPVAGIALLGQAVNIIEYAQRPNNIISYAVSLPTLAAIGWAHDKVERKGRSFDAFIKDARDYGAGEYLTVLFQGDRAPAERKAAVARRLQEFTGLPAEEFLRQRLKVAKTAYQRLLFPGKRLDTNDARYFVPDGRNSAPYASRYEPEAARYFQDFLKVPAAAGVYALDNPAEDHFADWQWAENKTPFGDWPYVGQLKRTMEANPRLRLFVANGYYDTQTTIGAMDYLVNQSGLPLDRVETHDYHGGHMFYTVEDSLKTFADDLRRFVATTTAR